MASKPKSGELNEKQKRFADEYLKDLNGKQAAIRAGYSPNGAEVNASKLLTNHKVINYLASKREKLQAKLEISQERVLAEYAKLAFFDPRKLFDETGRPLPIGQLDDDTAAAIAGIDVATIGNAEQGVGEILKVKVSDKKGALDSLSRHLGLFNDKLDLNVNKELGSRMAKAKARIK